MSTNARPFDVTINKQPIALKFNSLTTSNSRILRRRANRRPIRSRRNPLLTRISKLSNTSLKPHFTPIKSDYCNIEKYSKTSTQLYSFLNEIFNSKKQTKNFLKCFGCCPLNYYPNETYSEPKKWFVKPDRGSMGNGIVITTNPLEYIKGNDVIEESINMRLIRKRRWDLRVYVFHTINNSGNLKTYLFKDGLVRLCPEEFNIININKRNMCSNTSLYIKEDLNKNLNYCMSKLPEYNNIFKNIKHLLRQVHNKMKLDIIHKKNFFLETQLMGYDIIISEANKPYILEINNYPHYITKNNTSEIKVMKDKLVEDIYNIIKGTYLNKTYPTDFILVDS